LGRHKEAINHYEQALQLYREFEDSKSEADVLASLGDAYLANGNFVSADATWRHALAIFQKLGYQEAARVQERIETLDDRGDRG
jgi:tetratricopeptide (TPR) repeat protein